jgi:release factor glutamine methyltransferase
MQQTILAPTTQRWTVLSLVEWSTHHLVVHGFDEARLHVELLLSHVLGLSRLQLYTNFDRPLSPQELTSFRDLFKRRLTHEPLQYIIGETEFMGLPFFVDKRVLIPRPETELLVQKAIDAMRSIDKEEIEVLDIGTGSGNIPVAIAKFVNNCNITSLDVSKDAIDVARVNAERNNVPRVTFLNTDIFSDDLPPQRFDVIISNPPYIAINEMDALQPEVRDYEPRIATTDLADGYRFIRRIAAVAQQKLEENGYFFMEIAYNQSELTKKILEQGGLREVIVHADYAGHPRIATARK